jgi:type IV pilus assembly protein PilF
VKRWLLVLCLVCGLAGCADDPGRRAQIPPPAAPPQPEPANARSRAAIHTELGANYYASGQYKTALEELNEAVRADSTYGPAYNVLGLVHMELNEDEAAERYFQQALRIDPQDPEANNNYGWYLCNRERETEALGFFQAALRNPLYTTPEKALVNAGVCARKLNNDKVAEDYFLRALKAAPSQPRALFNLAEIYFKQNRLEGARKNLNRLLQTSGPSAPALWLGVNIERKLGDRNAEASYAAQLRNRFPEAPETQALSKQQYE